LHRSFLLSPFFNAHTQIDQDSFSPDSFIFNIKPIANNPTPISRIKNDCQRKGLNIGEMIRVLAPISS